MAVTHKGAISFGLVHIPVSLHTATQDNDISFNQLHEADNSRINYKKVCSHCGKEVKQEDIVKGFQYEKGHYVTITDEEIEKIKTEKDKTIQIIQFSNLNQISPVYYDKAYRVSPDKGGEKALELLRYAMMEKQKVALGRSVFGTKEKMLIIIPREDGILIQTLLYQDEIKDFSVTYDRPKLPEPELLMAQKLIESMDEPFDASKYKDEFQAKLRDLIEAKIEGKEIIKPKGERQGKIIDIMEALKASISQNSKNKTPEENKKSIQKTATASKTAVASKAKAPAKKTAEKSRKKA